jgi:hypothetical protein
MGLEMVIMIEMITMKEKEMKDKFKFNGGKTKW